MPLPTDERTVPIQASVGSSKEIVASLIGCVLEQVMASNPIGCEGMVLSSFTSMAQPGISIGDYLYRVSALVENTSTMLLALYHVRTILCKRPGFHITPFNIHRIMLASLLCAVKVHEDKFYKNALFAKLGGVAKQEMNKLEVEFLGLIAYDLFVSTQNYDTFFADVTEHSLHEGCCCAYGRHIKRPLSPQSQRESEEKQRNQLLLLQRQQQQLRQPSPPTNSRISAYAVFHRHGSSSSPSHWDNNSLFVFTSPTSTSGSPPQPSPDSSSSVSRQNSAGFDTTAVTQPTTERPPSPTRSVSPDCDMTTSSRPSSRVESRPSSRLSRPSSSLSGRGGAPSTPVDSVMGKSDGQDEDGDEQMSEDKHAQRRDYSPSSSCSSSSSSSSHRQFHGSDEGRGTHASFSNMKVVHMHAQQQQLLEQQQKQLLIQLQQQQQASQFASLSGGNGRLIH